MRWPGWVCSARAGCLWCGGPDEAKEDWQPCDRRDLACHGISNAGRWRSSPQARVTLPFATENFVHISGHPEWNLALGRDGLAGRSLPQICSQINGELPLQLAFVDNARAVTSWCELRKAFRFFRTDRISSAEIYDRYPARRADLIRDFHAQLSDEHSEAKSPDRN
jgi:hypothetical protein